ncbi:transcriptional regulator [Synechococcus sp. 63AY4M2]|uniref:LCP family protein n=2 Tax=Synechococcus TaxID=1129 RepID=UPI000C3DBB1D|nr:MULTISPECIES: LCP family protein [unclassified Synechococcus]PIK85386.1 transcriptional regulator [Synechococcus sp. 63AY4M2]PIK94431.1 transcriptional regulator [Synechococcus sp. 60AY4M2]PIK96689.1 transcriptional regulator [Synechococcus sp. 63AY4M1]PIL00272.1 transcriptional regulator [Synechococcus sp. 65AY640]
MTLNWWGWQHHLDSTPLPAGAREARFDLMSSFHYPPRPDRVRAARQQAIRQGILWLLLGFTAVLAGSAGAFLAVMLPRPVIPTSLTPGEQEAFRPDALRAAALDRSLHILILGTDNPDPALPLSRERERLNTRTDTILLARFDPQARRITILSIPRDTRVRLPSFGVTKINAANLVGGPALTAQVVSTLLGGIPIDRYVRLNTDALEELIDAVGGVEVYVPEPMHYVDHTQRLFINLEPGWQRLNGEQAHHFARFRRDHLGLGDIGRVQRQQELLRALSRELLSPAVWPRIPKVLQVVRTHLDTNLTWEEVLSLAKFVLTSGGDRIDLVLLPGRFSQPGEFSTSYWLPDPAAIRRVAVSHFGLEAEVARIPPQRLRIAVQNATGKPGMARRMVQELVRQGYTQVFAVEDSPQVLPQTEILAQSGDREGAKQVRAALGLGELRVESTGVLNSDITIRIGQDWAQQLTLDIDQAQSPARGAQL